MPKPSTSTDDKPSGSTAQDLSSQDDYWEAIEILDQKGGKYLVSWAGIDSATGKQWDPTWVRRVTVILI
jgi:hypothetical protein